jgi:outer membrane protein assembly factor BamB
MTTRGRPFRRDEPDRLVPGRRRHSDQRRLGGIALLLIPALLSAACGRAAEARLARAAADPPAADVSWPTFGGNPAHESVNLNEKVIDTASVSRLHRVWSIELPELADERPILAGNLLMPDKRRHDVLYVTTDQGTLTALDAATGASFWAVTPKNHNPKYTKSTPAMDLVQQLVYSYGLDGSVHRFKATTGVEMVGGGWPVTVTRMPVSEKISSALNLVNGYLYVTTASFSGDAPPYQGHLVAIDVKSGATHIFNSLCNDHTHLLALNECKANGGGIWGRPGVEQDPVTGNIFFTVSDGEFSANHKGQSWGDTVIEMTPDGAKVLDSYTPENFESEAFQNRDLGSTAPTLLPTLLDSKTPFLAVQAGKEGLLRLLNRLDLSGRGGPAHVGGEVQTVTLPDQCPTLAQPVAWKDPAAGGIWVFVATLCHMDAYRVVTSSQGTTRLQPAWYLGVQTTSPVVSGGVLFAASSENLLAIDPRTGHQLWGSAAQAAGGTIAHVHWESPLAVGGRVYCSDESNHLSAYGLGV